MRTLHPIFLIACCLPLACSSSPPDDSSIGPSGPVAANAAEAWPEAPANVPVLKAQAMLDACATAGACSAEVMQYGKSDRVGLVELCISDLMFSAERAIPISEWSARDERAEFWVDCVLAHAGDCNAVNACSTERNNVINCQEDGCKASEKLTVSCNGSVATLKGASGSFTRDCARAYAECDPQSSTGCTDRHYSKCPPGVSTKDRCDGDIRLGCDGTGQVSYHDCSRMGGTCATTSDGSQGCVYPTPAAECGENPEGPSCNGTTLSTCVNGQRLEVSTPICSDS